MYVEKESTGSIELLEMGGVCGWEEGARKRRRRRVGERNVSRVCHIPALCRILCLFTPLTGGNEVRGDDCSSLLSVPQQKG